MAKKKVLDFFAFQLRDVLKQQNRNLKELKGVPGSSEILKEMKGLRKKVALVLSSKESLPRASSLVDRQINARAKGIRFVRIRGRIVPIRPKK